MPLHLGHVKAGLHPVHGTLDGRAADLLKRDDTILVGWDDDSLAWSIE